MNYYDDENDSDASGDQVDIEDDIASGSATSTTGSTSTFERMLHYKPTILLDLANISTHLCDLSTYKNQIQQLVVNIRSELCIRSGVAVKSEDIFSLIFKESTGWFNNLRKRLQEADETFESDELAGYLECVLLCHIYRASPTTLLEDSNNSPSDRYYKVPIKMKWSRFLHIQKQFNSKRHDNPNHEDTWTMRNIQENAPRLLKAYSQLGALSQELAYMSKYSTISLDDEKVHLRSPVAKELGLATIYQRGGSKGVTLYEAVDKNLGILLAISIQQLHEKTKDCAFEALTSTFNFNLLRSLFFNNFLTY